MPTSFKPAPEHTLLAGLVGAWTGPTLTWLDPDGLPESSTWKGEVAPLLEGRFVRFTYTAALLGKPHAGELTVGFDKTRGRWTATWMDGFHNGTAIMALSGEGPVPDVRGSYSAAGEVWGWRVRITPEADGTLAIEHWNVSPGGGEDRALTTRLKRA